MKRIAVAGMLVAFILVGTARYANAGSHSHAGAIIGGVVAGVVLGHALSHVVHYEDHHHHGYPYSYYYYPRYASYPYYRVWYPPHQVHEHDRHCGHFRHSDGGRGRHHRHGGYAPPARHGGGYRGSYGSMVAVGPVR